MAQRHTDILRHSPSIQWRLQQQWEVVARGTLHDLVTQEQVRLLQRPGEAGGTTETAAFPAISGRSKGIGI